MQFGLQVLRIYFSKRFHDCRRGVLGKRSLLEKVPNANFFTVAQRDFDFAKMGRSGGNRQFSAVAASELETVSCLRYEWDLWGRWQ